MTQAAPKLLIRADADSHIGAGHVMRMVALGRAWIDLGGECLLATGRCPSALIARATDEGIHHTSLAPKDLAPEEIGGPTDLALTRSIIDAFMPDWLAMDGYQFCEPFCQPLFDQGPKLMVMDDFGYCDTWFVDHVVNQNFGAPRWGERGNTTGPRTGWLLGTQYALLRREFNASAQAAVSKPRPWRKVLVTLGGADDRDATGCVAQALESAECDALHLRVLVSPSFPHRAALDAYARDSRHHVDVLTLVKDMPAMYLWADAVVSAGGSTCWEWLAHGLSGAILTVAENQKLIARDLSAAGLAVHLGPLSSFDPGAWGAKLGAWIRGEVPEAAFNERRAVVDGQGASRLAAKLLSRP